MRVSTRTRVALSSLAAIVVLGAVFAVGAGDLLERAIALKQAGRYDLARDLLDDQIGRGEIATDDIQWLRLQLETDPDRFDREALALANRLGAEDPRHQEIVVARASEQFARGRYQTASTLLEEVAFEKALAGRAALLNAMSLQALGQTGASARAYESIAADDPAAPMARALLAELQLRAGRPQTARAAALEALELDPRQGGAIARAVLARLAIQDGDLEEGRRLQAEVVQRHPSSPEAAWRQEETVDVSPEEDSIVESDVTDGRRDYALQLGAFRDRSLALRLARQLPGEEIRVESDASSGDAWYRVVAGSYVTRQQAENARATWAARGRETVILGPERRGP